MINNILVIITGCSRGLGASLSSVLHGYDVLCVDRKTSLYESVKMDLSSKNLSLNSLQEKVRNYKKIIFINNASIITPIVKIDSISIEDVERSIYTNYINPVNIITSLLQNKKLYILINISSGAVFGVNEELSLYSSSKAAMHKFIEILKKEEKNNKYIKYIDNFDPKRMNTSMQKTLNKKKNLNSTDMNLSDPGDVAQDIKLLIEKYIV